MSRITLLGASGAMGKSIADALRNAGEPYRVVARSRSALQAAFASDPQAEIVTWDPDNPESVRAALRGTGTLIYLVGVAYDQFRLHPPLMKATLEAAKLEGVERLLLISTVYPYGVPQTMPVKETHPRDTQTFKGRMRKDQQDLVMAAGARGDLQYAILVLPDFYGPGMDKSFLSGLFTAAVKGGVATMLGPIDKPHEFVFVPDVGPVVVAMLRNPGAWGRLWNLAGPGVTTQRAIADMAYKITGRKRRLLVAGKTMLRMIGIFDPIMRELVEMNYLLTNPVILDDSDLRGLLGPIAKTSYEDGVRACIKSLSK